MKVRIQSSGRSFVLLEDYKIETRFGWIMIPKKFKTDLASIPKIFWFIVSPLEAHFPGAVLHDYFYRVPSSRMNGKITREVADDIFLEEMEDLFVVIWKRWAMHRAVRWGGKSSWRKE